MDYLNRIVRGSKTPALMPRVSGPALSTPRQSTAGSRGNSGSSGRGGAASNRNSSGGRGSGPGGRGGRGGDVRGRSEDDDMLSTMYDPLTGELLELETEGGKASAASAAAMVSPKCEDKVDYDMIVDLVDHIMTTEEKEAIKNGTAASAMGRGGGRGSGGGYDNRGGRQDGSWRGASNGSRGNAGSSAGRGRGSAGGEPLGAILIFLPGFAEIDQLVRALERHPKIGRGAAKIFPLHSSLPSYQQKSIFQRMPPGVRKIVVSTNIAETSVSWLVRTRCSLCLLCFRHFFPEYLLPCRCVCSSGLPFC